MTKKTRPPAIATDRAFLRFVSASESGIMGLSELLTTDLPALPIYPA
jgi:hypothetical protein